MRSWVLGQTYRREGQTRRFKPVITIADRDASELSFQNLVEVHVLAAIRRKHRVSLQAVRKAVTYIEERLGVEHPLAAQEMLTDGKDLLVEKCGTLLNVSRAGQIEILEFVEAYLKRIERDRAGAPIRLFPFAGSKIENASRSIVIDPRVQFGRPCLAGTGIPTAVIAERYKAGESISEIAVDYRRDPSDVEEALRFEIKTAA